MFLYTSFSCVLSYTHISCVDFSIEPTRMGAIAKMEEEGNTVRIWTCQDVLELGHLLIDIFNISTGV